MHEYERERKRKRVGPFVVRKGPPCLYLRIVYNFVFSESFKYRGFTEGC